MGKRSGKFYRKNENEVMELLGFEPTKGGANENTKYKRKKENF